ncbi:MAG TPA: glycosyltransferase family 28, partial [Pseudonocardiaceae bacterium]
TLNAGRFPILATRDSARGEQVDNHQHELATELARRGLAMHRDADAITLNDMLTTLGTGIRRSSTAAPFLLRS